MLNCAVGIIEHGTRRRDLRQGHTRDELIEPIGRSNFGVVVEETKDIAGRLPAPRLLTQE